MLTGRMGRAAVAAVLGVLLAACGGPGKEAALQPSEKDIEAARAAAATLGKGLKSRLTTALSEEGPASAIFVCSDAAPEIAAAASETSGMHVGRTALRVRNPSNAPDSWERAQLEAFAAAIEGGAEPAGLESVEIVTVDGAPTFRWMKPIVMEPMCALCHGEAVSAELKAVIAARYREDAATGFKPGELRGAFTVSKPLAAE